MRREWNGGEELVLSLPLEPRTTAADPRVDADRGCLALERGPLVYCLEAVDHPGVRLDDLRLDPTQPVTAVPQRGELGDIVVLRAAGMLPARPAGSWWPYGPSEAADDTGSPVELTAVPYFAWGNRAPGAMRVWVPVSDPH